MTQLKLKKLLSKKKEIAAIVSGLLQTIDEPISIYDGAGAVLVDAPSPKANEKYFITCQGEIIGWAVGPEQAELIAAVLTHLANREAEKNTLADELLERYRELNLLYNLAEKLTASLELAAVAQIALDEASRLIKAVGGWVMLLHEEQADLLSIAAFGQGFQPQQRVKLGEGIMSGVAVNGKAELVNDIQADPRYIEGQTPILVNSLVCAPLKTKNRVIGVIALGGSRGDTAYMAADLKLLNTVASQTAPAIENALLYEKALRESREREERLQRQIQELRIELDEARQTKQVAEITESDYFQQLRHQADSLREIIEKS